MKRRAKIAIVGVATMTLTTLPPTAPAAMAAGSYLIRNVSTNMCLTWGMDPEGRSQEYAAHTQYCPPPHGRDGYLWTRDARSELVSLYSRNKRCLGAPRRNSIVPMQRCGTAIEKRRITFTTVEQAAGGDRILITWKGRPIRWQGPVRETCLTTSYRNAVSGVPCDPSSTNQLWVLVR
ncbi:hypothetical protein [Nonomuraea sp. NPDC005501]|uniref:hypothetical protein n=1 Tax=Nonomuraea sp. NPDC005501 TaxID=3156884 RepID=UPI0033B78ACA